jgi:hypothetical protein
MRDPGCLHFALRYARSTPPNPVLPITPGLKTPLASLVPRGLRDATVDETVVRSWWEREPNAGVAIRCDNLVVLDIDPGGEESLAELEQRLGKLPETREQATPRGGRHLLFAYPAGSGIGNSTRGLGRPKGIDIRGGGAGFIVAAPTTNGNGQAYTWKNRLPVASLPKEWIEALTRKPDPPRAQAAAPPGGTIGTTAYGRAALEEEIGTVRSTPEGKRNEQLNTSAFAIGQLVAGGEIDPLDADEALISAAIAAGLSELEARRTVRSGLEAGREHPRSAPPREAPTRPTVTAPPKDTGGAAVAHPEAAPATPTTTARGRHLDGATFVFSVPETVPALWGDGSSVAWAQGEALMIVGPDGVGKTTLGQQLVLARIGLRRRLLGLPVKPASGRVLYIAADRPRQAASSLRRMVSDRDTETLRDRLAVWRGPLPIDVTARTGELLDWIRGEYGEISDVVVDSLKDLAPDLVKDETGSRVNSAFQELIANEIELVVFHHQRKEMTGAGKPKRLPDVYGSRWLVGGMGSVILLWGEPGDLIVDLAHLKQPVEPIGPMQVIHDHEQGASSVFQPADLRAALAGTKDGLTVADAARLLYGEESPDRNAVERARRRLEALVKEGAALRNDDPDGLARYFGLPST